MFRSILLLLSGNSFFSLMGFLRNLMVARLLNIEDYGIAVTFAVSLAIVEMLSNLGLKQMIVQDRQGDDPHMQATLQGFQLMRAIIAASALFLIAHPLANFLDIPHIAWAYQVMALMPLLKGMNHFDLDRMHRRMHFLPSVLCMSGPALVSLLLIWPLYLLFGDYRVMLYSILLQMALVTLASHLIAERRFQLSFDTAIMRRSFHFGWPILVNGALLFIVLHGEKLVVGHELGMEALAIFAMGFTLSLTPLSVIARSFNQFFLPQLSNSVSDPVRFNRIARVNFQAHFLCAALFTAFLIWCGPAVIQMLLGDTFSALGPLMAWLGILNAFRLIKGASALTAFALGATGNALWANLPRVAALPLAWYSLIIGGDLLTVIWVALFAEAVGFLVSLSLLRRQPLFRLRPLYKTIVLNLTLIMLLGIVASLQYFSDQANLVRWATIFLAAMIFVYSLVSARDMRAYIALRKWKRS